MATPTASNYGVKFPSRKERTVKRVTKTETRDIQKRLEPPKSARVRPPAKPKAAKKVARPATLVKPSRPPRDPSSRSNARSTATTTKASKQTNSSATRTLQATDFEKLTRLNCSREFSLFHQYIKPELSKRYENQLAFLQTKLEHLKNEFVNKQAEHLNFEQIKEYYNQALKDHERRNIKPDEFLTLSNKLKQDTKQAIDKWLKKKEFKRKRQVPEYLQRRQERIRDRIKETMEEQKKQQLARESQSTTDSSITLTSASTVRKPATTTVDDDDDDIMILD